MSTNRITWLSMALLLTVSIIGIAHAGTTIELSTDADITVNGIDVHDRAGSGVASGDINGDGDDDLIITAQHADPGGTDDAGEIYVIFGPISTGTKELSTFADITINGIGVNEQAGQGVACGDVNGDGADDIIIGVRLGSPGGRNFAGETYVLFGPLSSGTYELATSANIKVNGINNDDQSGSGVDSGDINNDGFEDLIIGAYGADAASKRQDVGEVYVLFGPLSSGIYELSNSADITVIGKGAASQTGSDVGSGDINNDGFQDLIIGARGASKIYVLFGPLAAGTIDLAFTPASITLIGSGTAGEGVASGDINNDGFQDLIIGADQATPDSRIGAGETFVLYGPLASGTIDLIASADIIVNGIDASDGSGVGVDSGDINNDGIDDLIIGAWGADPGGRSDAGETYVLFEAIPNLAVDIILDAASYSPGDQITLQAAIANNTPDAIGLRLTLNLKNTAGNMVRAFDSFAVNFPATTVFTPTFFPNIPLGVPDGTYTIEAALIDPNTWETLAADSTTFNVP